jgi:hypothetical protein
MKARFRIILMLIFFSFSHNAFSDDELSAITIPTESENINVYYSKKYSTIINQDITDESGIKTIRLLETKIKADSNESYIIDFDEGASWDPSFYIYRLKNKELSRIGLINALKIIIPGDGYFYTSGHVNNMFNQWRKWTIENDNLKEIKQPFYYVGIESRIKKDIDIFYDIKMTSIVEHIRKGTLVNVLMNYNNDYYLIKSEYGLTGWLKIPNGSKEETILDGIFYAGD